MPVKTFPHWDIQVKDESGTNPLILEEEVLHTPLFWGMAEKGEIGVPFYGSFAEHVAKFGSKTFDERSKYFSHATLFAKECAKYGRIFFVRIDPMLFSEDAFVVNNSSTGAMALVAVVHRSDVPLFEKDEDGNRIEDEDGMWAYTDAEMVVSGYVIKFMWVPLTATLGNYAALTVTSADADTQIFPILAFEMKSPGEYARNFGIKFFLKEAPDFETIDSIKAFLYSFGLFEIKSGTSTPLPIQNKYLDEVVDVALVENIFDNRLKKQMSFDDIIKNDYREGNLPFNFKVYYDNVAEIQQLIYDAIADEDDTFADYPTILNTPAMIDIFNGRVVTDEGELGYNDHVITDSMIPKIPPYEGTLPVYILQVSGDGLIGGALDIAYNAGMFNINVANSGDSEMFWSAAVTSGSEWISITSGASGTDTGVIALAFTENGSGAERIGTVTITAPGATGSPMVITVTQEAAS